MTPIIESNKKWIVSFLIFDFLFLGYLAFPERNIHLLLTLHLMKATTILLPLPAWLLSTLLPSKIKEILVFWRIKDPLPGSQAFTIHAPADNRINLEKLEEKIGKFPKCKKEQNALWYKLYRQVRSDISVISSHISDRALRMHISKTSFSGMVNDCAIIWVILLSLGNCKISKTGLETTGKTYF